MIHYFSMPADFKKETIDQYVELNNAYDTARIIETYGNITIGNEIESGRSRIQLPDIDLLDLREFVHYSKQRDIDFNYTINSPHLQNKEFTRDGMGQIKAFLADLYEAGIRSLTVALPSIIELVQSVSCDFKIKASTLCQVTTANKAGAYKKIGMERIVPDESINRNFGQLKRIRRVFGDKVEVIVNPICYQDCMYRMFHYNQIGGDSVGQSNQVGVNFYEHRCVLQRFSNISNFLRISWIRPEDIKYYTDIGIHYFKLQGRHLVLKGDALRTVRAYFDQDFEGDLMDIINMFHSINHFKIPLDNKKLEGFIKPFVENDNFCKRDCEECGYCEDFARKIIDYEKARQTVALAEAFYREYDEFGKLLHAPQGEGEPAAVKPQVNLSFNLD